MPKHCIYYAVINIISAYAFLLTENAYAQVNYPLSNHPTEMFKQDKKFNLQTTYENQGDSCYRWSGSVHGLLNFGILPVKRICGDHYNYSVILYSLNEVNTDSLQKCRFNLEDGRSVLIPGMILRENKTLLPNHYLMIGECYVSESDFKMICESPISSVNYGNKTFLPSTKLESERAMKIARCVWNRWSNKAVLTD